MTRKLILTTVLMLSLTTMVGCNSTKPESNTSSNSSNAPVQQEKSDDSTSSVTSDTNTNTKPKEEEKKEETKINKVKLSIYNVNVDTLEPNECGTIEVDENLSLESKLKALSKAVSEKNFNKLPIEIKSIDTKNGKKIATINLVDDGANKWLPKFQGSTGGTLTANTLIENFLQSNNKSNLKWIDGVRFLYNGKTIDYEHVGDLSNIQYRN
ncbi:hypothetical protein CLOBY_13470 [Clostridium saccharobutylicum]|uniref:hypothetical protein n=1 Tax=Clostridium saccharobutylicum TaxID=169679 RepID=UPI000983DA20|nr:hypothetical protein [Clostridium saccharobutylicum]AQS09224.1 hypothetical protein CLOBY_13470 [Clostridium saccharobutylicum]MBC2435276.1 hypothetical protein [Clostridium saccharobutylicum]NSB87459.1 hypothetical protein [Clostridium saccharobutylicum]NYC28413.1 hypothetical protein [Clostridium saccharobutylicum]OOM15607.1 hypothetical protein CLSAB_24490 [Clostridium saccharobutylicum]